MRQMSTMLRFLGTCMLIAIGNVIVVADHLSMSWQNNHLILKGDFPGNEIPINYLEAYCRPNAANRKWSETVIGHSTELISVGVDKRFIRLRDNLRDGVFVHHTITSSDDEIDFRLSAHNPGTDPSSVQWAAHCIRVGGFTGCSGEDARELIPGYVQKCFLFVNNQLTRMPTDPWPNTLDTCLVRSIALGMSTEAT